MRCATHPDVETELRCGRCGKPICPRCLVYTPVGVRCRDCARLRRLPVYEVNVRYYLRAAGGGVGAGIALGVAWGLMPFFGYFAILVAIVVGGLIGEAVSWAVNRKRGRGLQVVAACAVVAAYVVAATVHGAPVLSVYGLLALVLGIFSATSRLA